MREPNNGLDPIEAGWQELRSTLPVSLSMDAEEILRFAFFAGANHYRSLVRTLFENDNDDERYQTLLDIATEISNWHRTGKPFALTRKTP